MFQRDQVIDWNQVRPEILDVAPGRQVEQQGEGIGGVDASPAPQVEAPLQKLLCLGVFVAGHLAHQKAAEGENTSTPLSPCHTHTSTLGTCSTNSGNWWRSSKAYCVKKKPWKVMTS